jgi:translation initiation factor RLI1
MKIKDAIHRYGINSFVLFNVPVPKSNKVLGLVGI